jgi:hypothetical protein
MVIPAPSGVEISTGRLEEGHPPDNHNQMDDEL